MTETSYYHRIHLGKSFCLAFLNETFSMFPPEEEVGMKPARVDGSCLRGPTRST